jgi:hypothetical protein
MDIVDSRSLGLSDFVGYFVQTAAFNLFRQIQLDPIVQVRLGVSWLILLVWP